MSKTLRVRPSLLATHAENMDKLGTCVRNSGVLVLVMSYARGQLLGNKEKRDWDTVFAVPLGAYDDVANMPQTCRRIRSNIGNGRLFHRGPRSVEGGEGGEGGAQSLDDADGEGL
jgi:hypothetical protein